MILINQMQHISPMVFSAMTLIDPAITAVLSWLIGVEKLPSLLTWLGGVVVMAGKL
jgi:threonine/homoserine efflux transporter RhtA